MKQFLDALQKLKRLKIRNYSTKINSGKKSGNISLVNTII